MESIELMLDTYLKEYTWQTFYIFDAFIYICVMMIMRWCDVQISEYELEAIIYRFISTYNPIYRKEDKEGNREK